VCYFIVEEGTENININYAVDGNDSYYVKINYDIDWMGVFKYKDGDGKSFAGSPISLSPNTWYWIEVQWGTDGNHTVELYDTAGNELAGFSGTDSELSGGGIGFDAYLNSSETAYFDHFIIGDSSSYTGGWGPEVLRSSGYAEISAHADKVEDYQFYFDWNGLNEESQFQEFTIGGFGHTYRDDSGTTSLEQHEMKYWGNLTQSEITVRLYYPDGTKVPNDTYLVGDDDDDLLYRDPANQKTVWAHENRWQKFIDEHWNETKTRYQVRDEMETEEIIDVNDEEPGLVSIASLGVGIISFPLNGGVGVAITTADILANAYNLIQHYEKEVNGGMTYEENHVKSRIVWDWPDNPYPSLFNYSIPYHIDTSDVPSDQDLIVKVEQTHYHDEEWNDLKSTAKWEGTLYGTGEFELNNKEMVQ
jgi:hypothetical protein